MGIRQLRALIAIADTGSFRRAAERLFITQSAISMQMTSLEKQWSIKLFDRSKRPPTLYPQGLALAARARRIVEEYDTLAVRANSPDDSLVGSVRLGVVPSVATTVLPKVLLRARQLYPQLRIRVEDGLSQELSFRVNQGRIDAAIVTDPNTEESNLVRRVIWRETLKLIVHRDLSRRSFDELLSQYPFIRFNAAMAGVGRIIDGVLQTRPYVVDDAMALGSAEAICQMVALNLGISIIPENLAPPKLRSKIIALSLPPPRVARTVSLVMRPESSDAPAISRLFLQFKEFAPVPTGR